MRYRTHQVKTQKTQRFVVNLFSNLNRFKVLNDIDLLSINSLPSILKLSRLSIATYFNNQGVLSDAAADTARFDYGYDGTNWVNQGLLVEKQSTNSARYGSYVQAGGAGTGTGSTSRTKVTEGVADIAGSTSALTVTSIVNTADNFMSYGGTELFSGNPPITYSVFVNKASINKYFFLRRIQPPNNTPSVNTYTSNLVMIDNDNLGSRVRNLKEWSRLSYPFQMSSALYARLNVSSAATLSSISTSEASATVCYPQRENSAYVTSLIKNFNSDGVTRSPDNLQLNVTNYTGSIKLTYKRQDTEALETKWIDYTGVTNPILSNQFNVGVWLRRVVVYNRILTAEEKANA